MYHTISNRFRISCNVFSLVGWRDWSDVTGTVSGSCQALQGPHADRSANTISDRTVKLQDKLSWTKSETNLVKFKLILNTLCLWQLIATQMRLENEFFLA
jgi:hypothetical protein